MSADAYVSKIKTLDETIKRYNKLLKKLREQKKESQGHLYAYMVRRSLDEYKGIKLAKIAPKEAPIRKKQKDKKNDAIQLFNEIGIPDPEGFWHDFQETQKVVVEHD